MAATRSKTFPAYNNKYINKQRVRTTTFNVCSISNIFIVYACFFVQTIRLLYVQLHYTLEKIPATPV